MATDAAQLNRFTAALRELCATHVIEEKWLVAPSRRIGRQWLDTVTRAGQPVLNVRLTTLPQLALELAAPALERRGLRLLRGARGELLIERLWEELRARAGGYLATLPASRGLVEALAATVQDLRLAGVEAASFRPQACESRIKGEELRELLARYEQALEAEHLADFALVLRLAAQRAGAGAFEEGALVIAPESSGDERALELELWQAIPEAARRRLAVDKPGGTGAAMVAGLYRAAGEANELREVLRRCVEQQIPFDEVEVLCADPTVYAPLAFELACAADPESPRITLAGGLPVRTFRPGRALLAWVAWARAGFPQTVLARMIQDGLLELPRGNALSFARLAALLRTVPIASGRDRYAPGLQAAIASVEQLIERADDPDHVERSRAARRRSRRRLTGLRHLRRLVRRLLRRAPRPGSSGRKVLAAAAALLEEHVRTASQLDGYSRRRLARAIAERLEAGPADAAKVWDWLARLPLEARVGGQGPRPGCVHVASLHAGGHSGRRHTFIVGLDDSRFPGAGLQDPLLLDDERRALSSALPTAAARTARRRVALDELLARLRGSVTLSYPCRSLVDDRELHPASALVGAYRALTGDLEGDQTAFKRHIGPPAAFAPEAPGRCIDRTEWWLWRLCAGGARVLEPERVVAETFPCLGRGLVARRERASDRFTVYDGYVPQAGQDFDPASVLSASRLEKLGSCPQDYFFQYVLGLVLPEEYGASEDEWLGALGRGSLLHDVFCALMRELTETKRRASYAQDCPRLLAILDEHTARARAELPPPSEEAFRRDLEEMRRTARIFLHEEEAQARAGRCQPYGFEVAVGMSADGAGSPLDRAEPLAISLPGGRRLRVRGRIDRIDRLAGKTQRFAVWDYKTGSAWNYDESSPFRGGRQVQGAVYLAMAGAVLRESVSRDARATSFGYFFPAAREHGRRISWPARRLEAGRDVLGHLCELLAAGVFPFSDEADDATWSDYAAAHGDLDAAAAATRVKLANPANTALAPLRELRRHG